MGVAPPGPSHPQRGLLSFPDQVTGQALFKSGKVLSPLLSLASFKQYINNFQEALPERDGDGKFVGKLKLKCLRYNPFLDSSKMSKINIVYFENQFLRGHKEQHRKLYLLGKRHSF